MVPGDRLVCTFVKPQQVGTEFVQWPLHVTLVPWFRTDIPTEALADEIGQSLREGGAYRFSGFIGREAMFGGKTVNLIQTRMPFEILEQAARQVLKNHDAWIVDETTKQRRQFIPHVTAQQSERMQEGDVIAGTRLYIVSQIGGSKLVEAEVEIPNA